jgi:hypothetical protein
MIHGKFQKNMCPTNVICIIRDTVLSLFYSFRFLLDIFFIYISNVIPFSSYSRPQNPLQTSFPCFSEGVPPTTHPFPPPHLSIPIHRGIEPSQDQEPPFLLMPNKAILCYIYGWSHGSPHVYSLFCGLLTLRSGVSGWLILLFFLCGCKSLQLLHSFL